ncbi:MAG: helix-turn-helix domain-containing protein [Spirochaetales bacterium]|nr:helix-turn-helix domain-containing protein [Spirochaetales bacterium]
MKSEKKSSNKNASPGFISQGLFTGKPETKKDIHIKIFITVTLSVALSIIILTTILYIYFENIIVNKIYESEKNNLFQAGVSTRLMQELSKSIAIQMYNDFALAGLFFTPRDDPLEIYNAITHFRKYKDLIPYIHSIYIYNPINNTFYINSAAKTVMIQSDTVFFDHDIIPMLEKPEFFNTLIPVPRIITEPGVTQDYTEEYGVYTFIFNLSGIKSKEHSGSIIINISEKWVRNIIDSVDINPDSKVLIIDKNDRLLISDIKKTMLSKANIYPYIKDEATPDMKSGNLLLDMDNDKIFLVFSFVESFDWIFVKLIPYNNIMADVYRIRKNLLIIAVSILLLGTFFSFLFARRLYKPIDDILKRLVNLEKERKSDTIVLKQYNLKRLFTQSKNLSDYEINKFLTELAIGFDKNNCYTILLLMIDHYRELKKKYTNHEQNLLKLGILDTVKNILKTKYQNEGIEISDNHLAFLLTINKNERESFLSEIVPLVKEIQRNSEKVYAVSLSFVIGPVKENTGDISILYEKVLQLAQLKYLLGYGVIIDELSRNNMEIDRNAFMYPYDKEKLLIEAIHYADREKIISTYYDIIKSTLPYGYNALVTTRNTIAYAINKTINTLKQQNLLTFSFNFYNFFSEIINSETMEESNAAFTNLFHSIMQAIEKRNNSKNYSLITQIITAIENDYMDINLGIATLAYKYKLSAAYLGRLFKKFTGKSMPDYINELRITKTNELLKNTTWSMIKIMEMTGFTNKTHFYNMFKKYNGVTPKIYRQKSAGSN